MKPFFCFICEKDKTYNEIAFSIESQYPGGRPCAKDVCNVCFDSGISVNTAYHLDAMKRVDFKRRVGSVRSEPL